MSNIEIYYLSGTGNSLHAAKELARRLPDAKLIPIASFLDKETVESKAETVGFVFPIHMATSPIVVGKFIKKLDLQAAKYIFAVASRVGTKHTAFSAIDGILRKKGKRLDAAWSLNMPSNDPKFKYKPLTAEETAKLETAVQSDLEIIGRMILNKEKSRKKDTSYTINIPFIPLLALLVKVTDGWQPNFYADAKCTGCGTCEKVCLSRKIKMAGGQPVWQKNVRCFQCYACLNYCPQRAVQIKKYTEGKERYAHPYATAADIAAQKK